MFEWDIALIKCLQDIALSVYKTQLTASTGHSSRCLQDAALSVYKTQLTASTGHTSRCLQDAAVSTGVVYAPVMCMHDQCTSAATKWVVEVLHARF